ncbi:shikimate dehydrogenase [Roseivivax sediminis]|uniref:Shikimate dehydrogenase n=1 Tax=Roseivivax sediminis TaxID=936889 RepID=A0A1I1WB51_9RHOB|nr:shikimate dehydrogenase [Roseivivax sediminis]SFD92377.1 shikimate dehydrogenase [Roseivivax sediminis]
MTAKPPASGRAGLRAGLVGRGIALSRTPAMHEAEARRQGIPGSYRLFDLDDPELAGATLADIVDRAEGAGFCGLNVTYPCKIEVIAHLHALSPEARSVGAVNTVVFDGGRRIGHNTDLTGFARSFSLGLPEARRDHVLLLGAGGAGVAVAHALAQSGALRLSILDTDVARAERLCADIEAAPAPCRAALATEAAQLFAADRPDGIVNATPMGMAKLPGAAIDPGLLSAGQWVADIVYFPLETALLAAARVRGCAVLPGAGMAVFQAVHAFELFTGRPACPDAMRTTFDAFSP